MNKTAQDLRKDLANAEQQLKRVNNQIDDRLLKLAKAHPMAVVVDMNNTQIYALRVVEHWQIIQEYDVDVKLKYIEMIEKWIAEQNPYKQTEMF